MATKRKPGTVAAVNRAIDAMNRKANPPRKQAVAKTRLVQRRANPDKRSPYVLREKRKQTFPRYVIEMKEKERDPWMPRESFKTENEARTMAQTWAKHYPSLWIRVVDLKSK